MRAQIAGAAETEVEIALRDEAFQAWAPLLPLRLLASARIAERNAVSGAAPNAVGAEADGPHNVLALINEVMNANLVQEKLHALTFRVPRAVSTLRWERRLHLQVISAITARVFVAPSSMWRNMS